MENENQVEHEEDVIDRFMVGYEAGEKILELIKDVIRNNIDLDYKNDDDYLDGLYDSINDGIDPVVLEVQAEFNSEPALGVTLQVG